MPDSSSDEEQQVIEDSSSKILTVQKKKKKIKRKAKSSSTDKESRDRLKKKQNVNELTPELFGVVGDDFYEITASNPEEIDGRTSPVNKSPIKLNFSQGSYDPDNTLPLPEFDVTGEGGVTNTQLSIIQVTQNPSLHSEILLSPLPPDNDLK